MEFPAHTFLYAGTSGGFGVGKMKAVDYVNAAKFRFNTYPSHVILFVTGRCNARCNHCFYWKEIRGGKKEDELTLDEIKKISENFKHIKLLTITGGEPSLRDDVPDIVQAFHENNGLTNVMIHTNGILTGNVKEIATRIVKENPQLELNLAVSVDSLHEGHNAIRGVKGGFEKAKKTIELVVQEKRNFKNLNVTINTCLTYFNQDEVKDTIDNLFENFDIDGYYVHLVRGNPADGKAKNVEIHKYEEAISHLNKKNVIKSYYNNYPLASFRRTLDFLAPKIIIETLKKKKRVYPCKAGQSVIVISEKGEVFPCEMLDKSFGNLRKHNYDIGKLLFSKKGMGIKSFIKNSNCCCTWECAIMNNIVFNWRAYPRLLLTWLQLELKKVFGK